MNNSGADFGFGMGAGITTCLGAAIIFMFGFLVGEEKGKVEGEKKTALITVQALNKIKQQLPKDTKITNPFTEQQLNTLSYSAQDILKLF
jgi:hypothetical protein